MSSFKRKILQKLLRKNTPELIPRDVGRANDVDYYALYMKMDQGVSLAVTAASEFGIIGNYWAGQNYHIEFCIPYRWIDLKDFNIHYFWKHFEFRYLSIWSCLLLGETGLDRLRARLSSFWQFLYNRKPLIRHGKIEILRLLVDRSLQEQNFQFSATSLMTTLHTERWVLHPDKSR
jgi:hypothetical protein